MTKEIYENSVLDDSAEAIEEQETELCEDAAWKLTWAIPMMIGTLSVLLPVSKDSA